MPDKETANTPTVFICSTGMEYIIIRCKTCGKPWMFNKNPALPFKEIVEGEWECPFCKRGYIQVKE